MMLDILGISQINHLNSLGNRHIAQSNLAINSIPYLSTNALNFNNVVLDLANSGLSECEATAFLELVHPAYEHYIDATMNSIEPPFINDNCFSTPEALEMVKFAESISCEKSKFKDLIFIGPLDAKCTFDLFKQFSTLKNKNIYFFSFEEQEQLNNLLRTLNPHYTFISISSSSLVSAATMSGFKLVSKWLSSKKNQRKLKSKNITLLTRNRKKAKTMGTTNIFNPWHWQHSNHHGLAEASLALTCCLGKCGYLDIISAINCVRRHIVSYNNPCNIPVAFACISIWHKFFVKTPSNSFSYFDGELTQFRQYITSLNVVIDNCSYLHDPLYNSPIHLVTSDNHSTLPRNKLFSYKSTGFVLTNVTITAIAELMTILHISKDIKNLFIKYIAQISPSTLQNTDRLLIRPSCL